MRRAAATQRWSRPACHARRRSAELAARTVGPRHGPARSSSGSDDQAAPPARAARATHEPRYELIPPDPDEPGKGLAALPEPSPLDVFFDIEADPWALDDGLEYLFGWSRARRRRRAAIPRRSGPTTGRGEKAAFERSSTASWSAATAIPAMHVYHYGGYESGALKRLMQRHATREDEIDVLLRGRVLVEPLRPRRPAGHPRVASRATRSRSSRSSTCRSARAAITRRRLLASSSTSAGWRRGDPRSSTRSRPTTATTASRPPAARLARGATASRPRRAGPGWRRAAAADVDGEPPEDSPRAQAETRAREDALHGRRARRPAPSARTSSRARWLLAGLLDWHRREAKPQWWDHFRLVEASAGGAASGRRGARRAGVRRGPGPDRASRASSTATASTRPRRRRSAAASRARARPGARHERHGRRQVVAFDPLAGTIDLKRNARSAHTRSR